MHMPPASRTTLLLRNDLVAHARRLTGIQQKTELIHTALQALIATEAARKLAALGGIDPTFRAPPRRRAAASPKPKKSAGRNP